ncbi:HPP family protein [Burkholderia plantarii]|uniref:HPP family protein n=1 Tax=Burkholderia plantarii TaxID=41899 RepID=UPI00272DA19A|nr:HPP family protein [Burkholderia plantarii]WLE58615.1 HPP family protein [Burkholderia plantarii]
MSNPNFAEASLPAACLAVVYLCLVSSVGKLIHNEFAFFPELAALGYGIFMRPNGPWAKAPLMVLATPTVTALWGMAVATHLPYGAPAAILCIAGAILIVKVMKSPVFPAVPAAFLPLVFGVTSLHYVVFIACDTGALALLSMAYRPAWQPGAGIAPPAAPGAMPAPGATASGKATRWVAYWCVLAIAYLLAARAGIRLILFPPLLVLAYEMLIRPEHCPWARRAALVPVLCVACAALGWASVALFGTGPLSVLIAFGLAIVLIRAADAFVLPALAISVIPQIMPHVDWKYPLAIGTGTCVVVAVRAVLNVVEQGQARATGGRAIE